MARTALPLATGPHHPGDTCRRVGRLIDLEFDLLSHTLLLRSSDARQRVIELHDGLSVAAFYRAMMEGLEQLGVNVTILTKPCDPARVGSDLPFKLGHGGAQVRLRGQRAARALKGT